MTSISLPQSSSTPVTSHNEWDPLEEVVVGVVEGAAVPAWNDMFEAILPGDQKAFFERNAGKPFPAERIAAANRDLAEFVHLLEGEGVTVRRPDPLDFTRGFATPDWSSTGLYAAMPRDLLIVVGDEIIESPLSWRSRHCEIHAFRPLLTDYFRRGARWTSAPTPMLRDDLFLPLPADAGEAETFSSIIGESEPVFDAADFVRCGRDLFVQQSHVTNALGIEWMRRHLGKGYRIHEVETCDPHPMHIDASLLPLAPGKLLINPERIQKIPDLFKTWDVLEAPTPEFVIDHPLYMCSRWISMNLLVLDERRVVVERQETQLAKKLRDWGFETLLCSFANFYTFGGSFHCATLDVRRRGELQSYF